MNNFNFLTLPVTGISTNSEQMQPQPEDARNHLAPFAGMATSVHPAGQPQIFDSPTAYQQRQLSNLNVFPYCANQYLPQTDPFRAISTYQKIPFDEGSQLPPDFYGGLESMTDISELIGEELADATLVPPKQKRPEPTRKVIISKAQDKIRSSISEYFNRAETGETLQKRATSATPTDPLTEPAFVPPPAVPQQSPNPTDCNVALGNAEEKLFKCAFAGCNKRYKRKRHLTSHFMRHIPITHFRYHYSGGVNVYYRDPPALNRYFRTEHTFDRPYQCEICDKRFGRTDTLKYHKEHVHAVENKTKSPKRKKN